MAVASAGARAAGGHGQDPVQREPSTPWADWGAFAVGAALAATPLLGRGHGDGIGASNVILIGLGVMTTAVFARVSRRDRWHFHGLLVAFGLWAALMPALWTYVARVYRLASGVAGGAVLLLMIWPLWLAWRAAGRRREAELAGAGPTGSQPGADGP